MENGHTGPIKSLKHANKRKTPAVEDDSNHGEEEKRDASIVHSPSEAVHGRRQGNASKSSPGVQGSRHSLRAPAATK